MLLNIFTAILRYPTGKHEINRGYLFFSVKDRNFFHRGDTVGNIFTSGAATSENITDGAHEMKSISIFHRKKTSILFISCFQPFL